MFKILEYNTIKLKSISLKFILQINILSRISILNIIIVQLLNIRKYFKFLHRGNLVSLGIPLKFKIFLTR